MNTDSVQDLKNLIAPLDPASRDRITDAELEATAVPLATILIRAQARDVVDLAADAYVGVGAGVGAGAGTGAAANGGAWYRRRVLRWAVPGVVVALAGGAIAAAVIEGSAPSQVHNEVRCYTTAHVTTATDTYTDTAQASTAADGSPDVSKTVADALDACGGLWQAGWLTPGGLDANGPNGPANHPVPNLVACVSNAGEAAVFPGDALTCKANGMASLADR